MGLIPTVGPTRQKMDGYTARTIPTQVTGVGICVLKRSGVGEGSEKKPDMSPIYWISSMTTQSNRKSRVKQRILYLLRLIL